MSAVEKVKEETPTILYVDDEKNARESLKRRFTNESFHLITAAGGYEALDLIGKVKINLVILDISMPAMDGFYVFKNLRYFDPLLPIIMLTGLKTDYAFFKSVELGCNGFLEKPYEIDDLIVQIESILAR